MLSESSRDVLWHAAELFYTLTQHADIANVLPSVHMCSTGYTNTSALLYVSTNQSNPFTSGSLFRRTGLEGGKTSYTDEGISFSDPVTCVVSHEPLSPS